MKLMMKSVLLLLTMMASMAWAETAVIVSASNGNGNMDKATITKIFLGKAKSFPDGNNAIPIDQNEGAAVREAFNGSVLGKSSSQLKAYWSRLIFTGKGTPPKESGGDADIVALVAANPNLIGYVDAAAVTGDVKVVYKF